MAFFARDPCKTDIEETEIKYIASQAMLRCNADSYVDFMIQKLQFVKANDDPRLRLEMIQDDKWLSAGFDSFYADSRSFPTTVVAPLYICKPNEFKRGVCSKCQQYFCCSRNFKGKKFACSKCENNKETEAPSKRQKTNPVSATVSMGNSSAGSNGSNGSAIRAARAIAFTSIGNAIRAARPIAADTDEDSY